MHLIRLLWFMECAKILYSKNWLFQFSGNFTFKINFTKSFILNITYVDTMIKLSAGPFHLILCNYYCKSSVSIAEILSASGPEASPLDPTKGKAPAPPYKFALRAHHKCGSPSGVFRGAIVRCSPFARSAKILHCLTCENTFSDDCPDNKIYSK